MGFDFGTSFLLGIAFFGIVSLQLPLHFLSFLFPIPYRLSLSLIVLDKLILISWKWMIAV